MCNKVRIFGILVMWSENNKLLEMVIPRSRHELTTGSGEPLIKNMHPD